MKPEVTVAGPARREEPAAPEGNIHNKMFYLLIDCFLLLWS